MWLYLSHSKQKLICFDSSEEMHGRLNPTHTSTGGMRSYLTTACSMSTGNGIALETYSQFMFIGEMKPGVQAHEGRLQRLEIWIRMETNVIISMHSLLKVMK